MSRSCALALLCVAGWSADVAAEPVRLGEAALRAVVIDPAEAGAARQANDWRRGSSPLIDPHDRPLGAFVGLRPSLPVPPQAARSFTLGHPADE